MDLQSQAAIRRLSDEYGTGELVVVLGAPDPEAAELAAETVVVGDPTFAGPLTEVQLGLPVYHILESEVRQCVPTDVWDSQIGVMADVLDSRALTAAVSQFRSAPSDKKEE